MSRYAHISRGGVEGMPGLHFRSRYERNVARILRHLREHSAGRTCRRLLRWEYEPLAYPFPGQGTTGNYNYRPDFPVAWLDHHGELVLGFLEVKGLLRHGGRLTTLDLSDLDARSDSASRIKLSRWLRHYPAFAAQTWVIGEREYRRLERRYGWLPGWESDSKTPKRLRETKDATIAQHTAATDIQKLSGTGTPGRRRHTA